MNTSTRGQMWHGGFSQTGDQRSVRGRPDWTDAVFFLLLAVGAGYALTRFSQSMDYYEKIIPAAPCPPWSGWAGCGGRCGA